MEHQTETLPRSHQPGPEERNAEVMENQLHYPYPKSKNGLLHCGEKLETNTTAIDPRQGHGKDYYQPANHAQASPSKHV